MELNKPRTIIYIGDGIHPVHGSVAVLGYQNSVRTTSGPNAMILHFPTSIAMGKENVIDTSQYGRSVLNSMVDALEPPAGQDFITRGGGGLSLSPKVTVFQSGIYHIVMSSKPSLIPSALEQVPPAKRPVVSQEVFNWYEEHQTGYNVALCCFNNADLKTSTPMIWWYKPFFENQWMLPGLDGHDGQPPKMDNRVDVDHWLILGSKHEIKGSLKDGKKARFYTITGDRTLDSLLPKSYCREKGIWYLQEWRFRCSKRPVSKWWNC